MAASLAAVAEQLSPRKSWAQIIERVRAEPCWGAEHVLRVDLDPWQRELIEATWDVWRKKTGQPTRINHDGKNKITVRAMHGPGKTYGLAVLIHLWAMSFRLESPSLATAPKQDHLKNKFFAALRKVRRAAIPAYREVCEVDAFKATWAGDTDWAIVGETANDPQNMAGYHDDFLLVCVDEASAVEEQFFPVLEGAISTGKCPVMILIGNPTQTQGTFALSHLSPKTAPYYYRLHVSLDKTRRVSRDWVRQMVDKYGEDSDVVRTRCYGEFPKESPDQLIYLHWIEAAWLRELPAELATKRPRKYISADVADGGQNFSAISLIYDYGEFEVWKKQIMKNFPQSESPVLVAELVEQIWRDEGCSAADGDAAIVDAMGVGAGTAGILSRVSGLNLIDYRGGEEADDKERFRNRRTQGYVTLADMLRTGKIIIDKNFVDTEQERLEIEAQLTCVRRKSFSSRVDEIETKKDLLARTLSPDRADSLQMRYAFLGSPVGSADPLIVW